MCVVGDADADVAFFFIFFLAGVERRGMVRVRRTRINRVKS